MEAMEDVIEFITKCITVSQPFISIIIIFYCSSIFIWKSEEEKKRIEAELIEKINQIDKVYSEIQVLADTTQIAVLSISKVNLSIEFFFLRFYNYK